VMEKDLEAMKSHGVTRGRHSPPFLLIGLVVVIVILSFNYWHSSTRLADLQQQDDELRQRFHEVLLTKNQLTAKNEILEMKVKENVETYDALRQIRDKKEEEVLLCKESLEASKRDSEIAKSEEEKKVVAAEEKLRKAERNITQQLQIHEQDGSVVVSLREANAKLSAQLSALQESLNDTPPSVPHSTSSSSSPSAKDCNQHCLLLVEAAQERLFKKIVSKFGQDALNVLESADFGIPRRPGRVMTGPPPVGKVPDDILVVGRDGKVLSGPTRKPPSSENQDGRGFPSEKSSNASQSQISSISSSAAALLPDKPIPSPLNLDKVISDNVGPAPNLNAASNNKAIPNVAQNVGAAPNLNADSINKAIPNVAQNVGAAPNLKFVPIKDKVIPDVDSNVGVAPPNFEDDRSAANKAAAVADPADAAAVAPRPPQHNARESKRREVNDIVDVEAEATDDEDDDAEGKVPVVGKAAGAFVDAAAVPLKDKETDAVVVDDEDDDDGKDGIDQLNHNLATLDGEAKREH